jgi:serine/threonine protein kinase/tetratricopeptide (TPR) repeat protein
MKTRFIHEAQAASALDHTNICAIHEIDETEEGQLFISMGYYEGDTVEEKTKQGPLDVQEALDITLQIAHGLDKAHKKKIIHRDIKSANIIVTTDGVTKILDFGIAKLAGQTQVTKDGTSLGTASYMSPEQTLGKEVDHRTDIWSLGVVLYEMLTGLQPFQGDYEQAVVYSIMNEEQKPVTGIRTGIPMDLERIVNKTLAKDPDERYQHLDELIVDLKHVKKESEKGKTDAHVVPPPTPVGIKPVWKQPIPLVIGAFALIVIVAGLLIFRGRTDEPTSGLRDKSIAVLPFASIDRTEESEIFSEGIHDDILSQIAKIHDLKVIARTSVLRYKNTKRSLREIAQELGVGTILEGSVRRSGEKVRIVAQLIDADTEEHLWTETYDRNYADIFAIQSDVAQKIAEALEATLTIEEKSSIERKPTENMEAYDFYLTGNHYWLNYFNKEGNAKAAEMYEKAIELDPGFSQAYAMLSQAYFVLYNRWPEEFEGYLQKGLTALNMATTLEPDLMEVHWAQGYYFSDILKDIDRALSEFSIALKKQPNSSVLNLLIGAMYIAKGEIDLGKKNFERAEELDPSWFMVKQNLSALYAYTRDYEKALGYANECITLRPESASGHLSKLEALYRGYGDLKKSREVINEAENSLTPEDFDWWFGEWKYFIELYSRNYQEILSSADILNYINMEKIRLADVYYLLGKSDTYLPLCDSLKIVYEQQTNENPDDIYNHWVLGRVYSLLGQSKEALRESQKAADLFEIPLNWTDWAPWKVYPDPHVNLVHVLILIDKPDMAIDNLEYLLSVPGRYSTWDLKLDPFLDPLRDDPRFQELIAKYSD